jgi:hypothetical protein
MTNEQGSSPGQAGYGPSEQPPRSKREVAVLLLRNSPWLSLAILLHLLLFAIFSIIYIAHQAPVEKTVDMAVNISKTPLVLPDAIEEPPEIIDRNSVPILPTETEGPVNPDPVYIPDADPGRAGEITDEIDPTKEAGIYNPDPEALSNLPSGATGGTPIGVGSVGHHGTGTPSAYASRRAGGGGRGGGGLGQGGGGGRGGMHQATDAALIWLKNHQSEDGSWSAANFSQQCKTNTCDGEGNPVYDVGLTGLAILCYLGAGETHQSPLFGTTVRNGLKYLLDNQDESGCFGNRVGHGWVYNHACATLAMAEAYGMTEAKAFREPAQRAINFVLKAQNPYSAWRYDFPPAGDNDSSVTGWMVMALKSAVLSGLTIDTSSLDNAVSFIDEITDPANGRTGYTLMGEGPSRLPLIASSFPGEKSESLTSVGILVRVFCGRTLDDDPMIGKGADLLIEKLPTWNPTDGSIDFYYWYYGTLAMHQVGGPRWEKWNEAIKTALVDHQRLNKDEDEYGSWDPIDAWSSEGGRVYATTLNCLSTEVYYRYDRVFGTTERAAKASDGKDSSSKKGDGR